MCSCTFIDESMKDELAAAESELTNEELKHEDAEKIAGGRGAKIVQPC
jgi:hypothetical protein